MCEVFADWAPVCLDKEEIDISDRQDTEAKLAGGGFDLIINAAAYTDVDGAEGNKEAALAVNEAGARNLALAAKRAASTLIHYSTDYVFPFLDSPDAAGPKRKEKFQLFDERGRFLGFPEDYPAGPAVNVYGQSKLAGEKALAEVGPEYYLLRTAWLYGRGGKNFVDTMLRLGRKKGGLSVVDDQWGSPTYTGDVARATRKIAVGRYRPGIYHVVNRGSASWYQLAAETFSLAGMDVGLKPIPAADYPLPAARPKYSVLRSTKGPRLRRWQEALRDYIMTEHNKF